MQSLRRVIRSRDWKTEAEPRLLARTEDTVVLLELVLLLAACGSSSSSKPASSSTSSSSTTVSSGASSTSATGGPAAPAVKTASNATLGTYVVDASGATLYTLTKNGAAVACTSSTGCLAAWPPLLLPPGVTSAVGAGVSGVATVQAAGGTQVTFGTLPLYHFAGDSAAGDTKGEGLSSFGGTWHVVKIAGSSATGGATSSTTRGSVSGY
jgi:predicted lipoprotein with Yx(FWY)xxD motif